MDQQKRKTVLVYRSSLLPLSETFIKEQVSAYWQWRGVLVGMRRLDQLPLDGLEVRLLRPDRPDLLYRLYWKVSRLLRSIPRPVVNKLKTENGVLLHVHFGPDALEAWPLAKALDIPMVVTLHGYDINTHREWWESGGGGAHMRNYPRRLLALAGQPRVRFIAVSDAIRRRAISYGVPADKISVRYIGIDSTKFSPSGLPIAEREQRVLFVGRLVEKKGCEYLIRAFKKVQEAVPDASLIIAGNGELQNQLQLLARQLGVHAQFLGAISTAEVKGQLRLAKILCLPSVTALNGDAEGFGLVILEAQASGLPVLTSAMGGAAEGIKDGATGFAFPERDVDILRSRLITILTNAEIATSLGLAGPKFVSENFDLHRCTVALEGLYDDMLACDRST